MKFLSCPLCALASASSGAGLAGLCQHARFVVLVSEWSNRLFTSGSLKSWWKNSGQQGVSWVLAGVFGFPRSHRGGVVATWLPQCVLAALCPPTEPILFLAPFGWQ